MENFNFEEIGLSIIEYLGSGYVTVKCLVCGRVFKSTRFKLSSLQRVCTCALSSRKLANQEKRLKEMESFALSRGGFLLSKTSFPDSKYKYEWKCSSGHVWRATRSSIMGQKTWCPICAGNSKRTLNELKEIIELRGGVLLTTEYRGVDALYKYECNLGHLNENQFKKIRSGQWCRTCNKNSKSEEITRAILQNLFRDKFPTRRPGWLKNSRGRQMELDGYCEKLSIAFEFQGIQHFKSTSMYRGSLQQRIADDETKRKLCTENGITLLEFTYLDDYSDLHHLTQKQLGARIEEFIHLDFQSSPKWDDAYIRNDRLLELKELLKNKNIDVLDNRWAGVKFSYSLICRVCGHTWKATGSAFFNSRRVAGCDKCARSKAGERNKLGIEVLQGYAKSFGGELLSDTYVKRLFTYKWRCGKGHIFMMNFNNMKHRKQFCPYCEDRQIRKKYLEP